MTLSRHPSVGGTAKRQGGIWRDEINRAVVTGVDGFAYQHPIALNPFVEGFAKHRLVWIRAPEQLRGDLSNAGASPCHGDY
ncbi:hypothetical protein XAC3810_530358 [Xanthomonas citri pv. citri]|nr:hypothetical protein XAC3824_700002 [Xanthomonas citri pv. citri]CEE44138.1 hypothetical protein XAC3810_530358 [Xanthomonas citri pv. citri]CEE46375.1 hypothetical protein XAC2911_610176 [Xanthomonas citri pv. citri]CEE47723.1 hypothetical protein XAC908_790002 [Xanthomonas citri pv. citri]CEE50708.1 hypothetical protein XACS584_1000176 [Xanthomonas citri pv. citri]